MGIKLRRILCWQAELDSKENSQGFAIPSHICNYLTGMGQSIFISSKGGTIMIEVGSRAPDFTLKDQNGKAVRLSSLKGKKVLLSFRPLAWTQV